MSRREDWHMQATARLEHYYKGYHLWRMVAFTGVGTAGILAMTLFGLIFLWSPEDKFFPVGPNGEVIPIQPLTSPNRSDAQLRAWTIEAVMECSTFGFHDFALRLEQCREYFTNDGYQGYRNALNNPANQIEERIIDKRQVMSAVASGTPQIINKSKPDAPVHWWRVEIPVTLTFEKGNKTKTIRQKIELIITRVDTSERLSGIGISQWRAKND
ncbi:DotI/IcmL family type IV secretion protein [Kiloniella sp.]|uniref:DotI/IcmL family type IV secretion protein n=1 Tax=Kiloniella sp. TaxID=1938587 RepID=UPI003B01A50C